MVSHSEIGFKTLEISNHQTFLSVLEKRQKIFIYTILDYQDNIKERFEMWLIEFGGYQYDVLEWSISLGCVKSMLMTHDGDHECSRQISFQRT